MTQLYHYTCDHRIGGIRKSGWLVPHPQIQFPSQPKLIWLTDLDLPDRIGLGLTSYTLTCDRTQFRVTVSTVGDEVIHWPTYARGLARGERQIVEARRRCAADALVGGESVTPGDHG